MTTVAAPGVRPRVLFVCQADNTHAQSWMALLDSSEFDVRVFATHANLQAGLDNVAWRFPTYTTIAPLGRRAAPKVWALLPNRWGTGQISSRIEQATFLNVRWLRWIIRTWQPHVVHTLRMSIEGELSYAALFGQSDAAGGRRSTASLARAPFKALVTIPEQRRPQWLVSAWGADINWHIHLPERQPQIRAALAACDGFVADSRSDIDIAVVNGLDPRKIVPGAPMPGTGGLDPAWFRARRDAFAPAQRRLIVIPKAMETMVAKTYTTLEALRTIWEEIADAEVWLLMCTAEVEAWVRWMPPAMQAACRCCGYMAHDQVLDLLCRARVMLAPSLADGTPNVMLEAMACGALPILSPLDSIREWIQDGENGLLVNALYPDQIARAVRRAMQDDVLCNDASLTNWQIVCERANRLIVREQMVQAYHAYAERARQQWYSQGER